MERDDARLIGSTLGAYRIIEHVGSGGMSAVYRVEHRQTHLEYALKILRAELGAALDRFGREAVALSRLRHPNVVAVVDFGVTGENIPFLVMEYVRGPTLEKLIKTEAPMSLARAARYARDIASALDEAHALGFVHRDVKPTNIMIHRGDDGRETVKLLDFGVVGLAQGSTTKRITMTGTVIGTPQFMSPEQCAGDTPSFPADLYALGMVLYEMISGRPAFVAPSASALMKMHIGADPPALPPCGGLEQLVKQLLQKLPAMRPQSAELVRTKLETLLITLPDQPAPPLDHHPTWGDDGGDDDTLPSPTVTLESVRDTRPMMEVQINTDAVLNPQHPPAPPDQRNLAISLIAGLLVLAAVLIGLVLKLLGG